jgi:hypothetical protein
MKRRLFSFHFQRQYFQQFSADLFSPLSMHSMTCATEFDM